MVIKENGGQESDYLKKKILRKTFRLVKDEKISELRIRRNNVLETLL